jgi:NADPH-dependent 2,4-dienoyl-CoA reductase/sulfur reductase-like enzyme
MSRENTFVIVGGGLAAGKTAEELRQAGHQGPVLVIGDESERPYIRPPLSKGYLLGKEERDSIHVHPEGWYQDHGVDLILGTSVTTVDVRSKEVALSDGQRVRYAKLLLATGSFPRQASRRLSQRPLLLGQSGGRIRQPSPHARKEALMSRALRSAHRRRPTAPLTRTRTGLPERAPFSV